MLEVVDAVELAKIELRLLRIFGLIFSISTVFPILPSVIPKAWTTQVIRTLHSFHEPRELFTLNILNLDVALKLLVPQLNNWFKLQHAISMLQSLDPIEYFLRSNFAACQGHLCRSVSDSSTKSRLLIFPPQYLGRCVRGATVPFLNFCLPYLYFRDME